MYKEIIVSMYNSYTLKFQILFLNEQLNEIQVCNSFRKFFKKYVCSKLSQIIITFDWKNRGTH